MARTPITPGDLGTLVRAGAYVVDEQAVAEAMVRSGVLVTTQPRDWLPIWTLEGHPGTGPDLA